MGASKGAVFLDRDGTIIEDRHYLRSPEEVVFVPGVEEALRSLMDLGYGLFLVTNQSGVGRGYFTMDEPIISMSQNLPAISAMIGSSVATITRLKRLDCWQRSTTRWIRGFPAIGANAFPGNRVEAYRAGMRPRISIKLSLTKPGPYQSGRNQSKWIARLVR